jgi:hypothetical protein
LLKNLSKLSFLILGFTLSSCATSSVKWEGEMSSHMKDYMESFDKFRKKTCGPKVQKEFEDSLKAYRGQGYWIPELKGDVDVEAIKSLLPEFEKKLAWIKSQKEKIGKLKKLPTLKNTKDIRFIQSRLLQLKKTELLSNEDSKKVARKESLKLLATLLKKYEELISKVSYLSNFSYPVDHLKNRKVYDDYKDKQDQASVKIANYTFLYRKLLEDGAYNKDHTGSDIYLRTTIDTLYYELKAHDFYLTEDARFDLDFVIGKIESELARGKPKLIERLTEWEERMTRSRDFYQSLTLPENSLEIMVGAKKSTPNKELILEHNRATEHLKKIVYSKQAETFKFWLDQPVLTRAIFTLETILINEVGGVDGEDALERMDVARVVMNRLDKPKYLLIGKKEFLYPYLKEVTTDFHLSNERWLNALFKQGEFSFTYYYMSGGINVYCPDMAQAAKKLRQENVQIALQVLLEGNTSFKATRYISRASMIGRIHMDSVWEDYIPYPERPGLLAPAQTKLTEAFSKGDYTFLYSFQDPAFQLFQVVEINGQNYALGEKNGIKLFFRHRNPHYFRYFTKVEAH